MRNTIPLLLVAALVWTGCASTVEPEPEPPKLVGRCTAEQLDQEPFSEWFRSGYDEYTPNDDVLDALRQVYVDDVEVSVFFGTWCGDSRREVPRWLKLFEAMELAEDRVELVAVDNTDEQHKRSPGGEERGLEIYRVPTTIVRRGGVEVARVVEHPVLSLERDLLTILESRDYEPNYASYPVVRRWLDQGLLGDANVSPRGLAGEIRQIVSGEGELTAAARVMLTRGDTAEAVKLLEVNRELYRESAGVHARLADALLEAGDREQAREVAERALQLNDDPERVAFLADLIERSR